MHKSERWDGRALSRPVWLLWLVGVVLALVAAAFVGLALAAPGGAPSGTADVYTVVFMVLAPIYLSVGAVIVSRTAGNRVGWVILFIGLLLAIEDFSGDYVTYARTPYGAWLPGTRWMDWISGWIWVPAVVGALALLPMLFPDGKAPSRHWKPLILVIAGLSGVTVIALIFSPSSVINGGTPANFPNPVGIDALGPASRAIRGIYILAILGGAASGVITLVQRFRRGTSDERHQIKWFAGAFGLFAVTVATYGASSALFGFSADWLIAAIICVGLTGIPLAVAVAILRYRLYDIDVVISRTLVYGSLAAFITAVYVGIVVGVGTLVGSGGRPNLVLSIVATAIVAVAFQPVREWVQKVANRLVYGKRATPYEVLSQFSERVAETYAAEETLPRMARVLAEGTGAESALVWRRAGKLLQPAATWPNPGGASAEPVAIVGDALPDLPGADAVEVRHQGELLGALTVTKRAGESLTPIERKLLYDLAHQAGLVLKNVGLTAELLARVEDLRASRQRLVAAQDEERRRLERNLHDGAQQNLVAIKVKLGLAGLLARKDPEKTRDMLSQLKGNTDEALETLRDLARGIYPPLLADRGLAAALESQARKATLPVEVDAQDLGRYSQEIEAAVYFCILEALQNVQKYAEASRATVRLRSDGGDLHFEVEDDGKGFDPGVTKKGSGTQNMEDRLDALGGSVDVTSAVGTGTTVAGQLPIGVAEEELQAV
jgi:signal transduction histidine kinase